MVSPFGFLVPKDFYLFGVVLSGYSASSTTKSGRHDIAEILRKVALTIKNQIKMISMQSVPITTNAVSSLRRDVLDTTLCDKACQWLVVGRWFSPVSSNNKTDRHHITEILLKVTLNTTIAQERGDNYHNTTVSNSTQTCK
jgi:hypothetical protein